MSIQVSVIAKCPTCGGDAKNSILVVENDDGETEIHMPQSDGEWCERVIISGPVKSINLMPEWPVTP
jgi:hypothetical protein